MVRYLRFQRLRRVDNEVIQGHIAAKGPQRLKPRPFFAANSARLKSCPFKTAASRFCPGLVAFNTSFAEGYRRSLLFS